MDADERVQRSDIPLHRYRRLKWSTIRVLKETHRKADIVAAIRGISMGQLYEELLQREMERLKITFDVEEQQ